jgi:magnesium-transporting ATPase (P-type)/class 3 adenylate cyclase
MKDSYREVVLGVTHLEFGDNSLTSSQLNFITFVPSFIFLEFRRVLNLWFVLISVLQLIFSDLHQWEGWSTIVFFAAIILFDFVKSVLSELAKVRRDSTINSALVSAWTGEEFKQVKSKDLRAGQFVRLKEGETLAADMVLLATSRKDSKCFVNLHRVTGRKDPDEKLSLSELNVISENFEQDVQIITRIEGSAEVQLPTPDFNSFKGTLKLKGFPRGIRMNIKQFLPRGALLTSTDWALGVVVYVGKETKMLLNRESSASKSSKLEQFFVGTSAAVILTTIAISLICAGLAQSEMQRDDRSYDYGQYLVVFLLTYQRAVPITLFILLELARLLFKGLLSSQCKIRNAEVLENLGHVEYILTGISGSATTGRASLKACLIGNNEYWSEVSHKADPDDCEDGTKILASTSYNGTSLSQIDGMFADFPDEANHLVQAAMLCNSSELTKVPVESAYSQALLDGVQSFGCSLQVTSDAEVVVKTLGGTKHYEVVFGFASGGCTYVVIRSTSQCWLYVKGDIYGIAAHFRHSDDDLVRLEQHSSFGRLKGLHMTVFAYKELTSEAADELRFKAESAKAGVVNEEGRVMQALQDVIDGLMILGATGLQEELVPKIAETISELSRAGTKIWLVSSQGELSATSCGLHLGLLAPKSKVLALTNIDSQFQLKRTLIKGIERYIFDAEGLPLSNMGTLDPSQFAAIRQKKLLSFAHFKNEGSAHKIHKALSLKGDNLNDVLEEPFESHLVDFSVVLDGMTFNTAIRDHDCRMLLVCCLFPSKSVIAYDFMPMQKAELCRLLQDNLEFNPAVLAIGEGDNDGPVMRTAQIGVSMNGSHSLDADIVLKNFSCFSWLINQRGRQISASLTRMMCLALYKNLAFTLVLFYYNFLCDFSGTQLYSSLMAAGLDLFFTVLPLAAVAVDPVTKAVKIKTGLAANYALKALVHSGLAFVYAASVAGKVLDSDGGVMNVTALGLLLYAILMLTFYTQVLLEVENNLLAAGSACFISAVALFICLVFAYPADFAVLTSSASAMIVLFSAPLSCLGASLLARTLTDKNNFSKVVPLTGQTRTEDYKHSLKQVYKNSRGWGFSDETEALEINLSRLTFTSPDTEHVYRSIKGKSNLSFIRMFLLLTAPLFAGWLVVIYFIQGLPLTLLIYRACIAGLLLLVWALTFTKLNHYSSVCNVVLCLSGVVLVFVFVLLEDSDTDIGFGLACVVIPLVFFFDFLRVILLVLLSICLAQVAYVIHGPYDDPAVIGSLFLQQFVILLSIGVLASAGGYSMERNSRERFRLTQIIKLEVEKSQSILSFLLPAFVKDRVRDGARYIAEDQGTVSILFCDISDFDRICAEYSPSELTGFLDDLFRKLDFLCDAHGVTKIETVGKTYMACAGLKDSEADLPMHLVSRSHARRVTDMALDIIRFCSSRRLKFGQPLQVKIGLNSGPVTAGVVGYHKPQFSLVGDTVNTASRMCSTLQVTNGIQMSTKTFELLGNTSGLAFTDSSVEAKGKGILATKLVAEDLHYEGSAQPSMHIKSVSTINRRTHRGSIDDCIQLEVKGTERVNDIMAFTCNETTKQAQFRAKFILRNLNLIKLGLLVGFALNLSLAVLELVQLLTLDNYATVALVVCRGGLALAYLGVWALPSRLYVKVQFNWLTIALALANAATPFINLIEDTKEPHSLVLTQAVFVVVFLCNCSGCFFTRILPISLAVLAMWLLLDPWVSSGLDYLGQSLCLILVIIINLKVSYSRESTSRDFANLQIASQTEIETTEKLVTQMMPARVYQNIKNDRELTEKLDNVTLLFADIVGFTAWSSDKRPTEVVGMLSELFTRFDRMTVEYGVYKVCTIGDCYVIMNDSSLETISPFRDTINVIEFAFAMLEAIADINAQHNSQLQMRIGAHFGELIAGITGTNIVRYDIYGPDVLIANKMESGGQAGRFNVSDVVKDIMMRVAPDDYDFEFNAEIQAKAINRTHKSYFVVRRPK